MIKTLDPPATRNGAAPLNLTVRDVTGTHVAELADLDPQMRVGTVAATVAARWSMPLDGTIWALRDDSARYLDDIAIGDAIETQDRSNVSLYLVPKAHLGATRI